MDRWIVSASEALIAEVSDALGQLRTQRVV